MRWKLPAKAALVLVIAVQALCTLFFVWDILAGVVGLPRRPLSWRMREMMEMGAGVGLVLGVALGAVLLFTILRKNRSMETQLRQASGAFAELLEERFRTWGLTPSERDVAWFTIKGLAIADIARVRQTSEGTVKAQSNAIYRKAGVSGRAQLVSLCIEDLIEAGPLAALPPAASAGRKDGVSRLAAADRRG